MRRTHWIRKLYHAICKLEVIICGAGFILLVALVFLSAILRFFRVSQAWNIDMALFLLSWTAFLGADIAWRSGRLVGVDIVTTRFPQVLQKIVEVVIYIVIFAALVIIVVFGIRLAWTDRIRKFQSMPMPYSLVTLSLVAAAFSMSISTILKIRRCILNFKGSEKEAS
jgi:TRAP-type C4-dicarboxylate transport system permease small subunit